MIKLLSCHIENFGKINSLDIDFENGLTEIIKENGYGKTTIANFIKAMFFGMPTTRVSDKDLGTRQRYYPFSGGLFGGNLTYEKDGKTYKIERFFDRKSDTKDILKVYENNYPLEKCDNYLGESLFEMNEETFIRTLFITSEQIEVSSNSQISSKLNNILDNTDETNNFSTAYSLVEDVLKKYKSLRGDNGLIKDKSQEILSLRQEISNLENIKSALDIKYLELKTIKEQKEVLEKQFENINSSIALLENFKMYDCLVSDADKKEQELKNLENTYNLSGVDDKFIEVLKEKTQNAYVESQKVNSLKDTNEVSKKLSQISNQFGGTIPTNNEIYNIENKIKDLKSLEFQSINNAKNKGFNYLMLAFLALLFIGVGVAFVNLLIGGILSLAGLVGGVISLVFLKNKSTSNSDIKRLNEIRLELDDFFKKLGYSTINHENNLLDLKGKINLYLILKKELEDKNKEIQLAENNLNLLIVSITDMIKSIGFDIKPNIKTAVDNICEIYKKYERAKEKAIEANLKAKTFKEERNLTKRPNITDEEINGISYNLKEIQNEYYKKLKNIENDENSLEGLAILKSKLELAQEELEALKNNYSIYTKTLEFLKSAEDNLHQKYIAPIKDRFIYYASKLEKAIQEKVYMDKDFKISFESNGQQYSYKHLSYGGLAISNLCLRLALVDNMFKGKTPFIILDDPFIGLDEVHFENMKKLIKELSVEKQIIYFTCHNSRSIS